MKSLFEGGSHFGVSEGYIFQVIGFRHVEGKERAHSRQFLLQTVVERLAVSFARQSQIKALFDQASLVRDLLEQLKRFILADGGLVDMARQCRLTLLDLLGVMNLFITGQQWNRSHL